MRGDTRAEAPTLDPPGWKQQPREPGGGEHQGEAWGSGFLAQGSSLTPPADLLELKCCWAESTR